MGKCEYTGKECPFWTDDGVGSCEAMFPEDCPYNSKVDAEVIKKWQLAALVSLEGKDEPES